MSCTFMCDDSSGRSDYGTATPPLSFVERTYWEAKDLYEGGDTKGAAAIFTRILTEDKSEENYDETKETKPYLYWTWKAYKNLAKCAHKQKNYDRMCDYFQKMLRNQYDGRERLDVQKAVHKFLERVDNTKIDGDDHGVAIIQFLSMIRTEIEGSSHERLSFHVSMKICQRNLERKEYTTVKTDLADLMTFCREGQDANQRKGTLLLRVVALEIQLQTELNNVHRLQELCNLAEPVLPFSIPDPRTMGIIRECEGKLFVKQSLWEEASDAFGQAFRRFEEGGFQSRFYSCLRYEVLASMLACSEKSKSKKKKKTNPLDTKEASPYKNHPELLLVAQLHDAYTHNDITAFECTLEDDERNAQIIKEDPFMNSFLEPLIRTLRSPQSSADDSAGRDTPVDYCGTTADQ